MTGSEDDPKNMRIAVAMSGGVDSSVTAMLLKEQGYNVVGATLLLHNQPPAARHISDAEKVAAKIGIPHHVFDLTEKFSETIIQDFADTYLRGETPLPCARCNKIIKFGALMSIARSLDAEALATGHYARRVMGANGAELHCAADATRDQSYFLFALDREQLNFLRFPLGDMKSKAETRNLARRFDLPVAAKPDSQDICFLPKGDYASLVARLHPEAMVPGDIVDEKGNILGRHEGIIHFTVGQRRGINLTNRVGENNEPLYVLRLDAGNKKVVVGLREALARQKVFLRDVNWLGGAVPEEGLSVTVKLRSAQQPLAAIVQLLTENRALITLAAPAFAVAPGQAGVVYDGTRVLGGGWIEAETQ